MLCKRTVLLCAFCAAAAVLGGCGSSSDSPSAALTKQQFAVRANAICRTAQRERDAVISQLLAKNGNKPALKEAEQEEVVLEVIKPLSRMTEELGSLEVDKATEVDAKAMVNSFSKTVTEIETDPGVTLEGGGAEFEEADKLAARLGAKECASF